MEHFLSGVYFVIDKSALRFFSWQNAEIRAMGESIIDIEVLKKYTEDKVSGAFFSLTSIFCCLISEFRKAHNRLVLGNLDRNERG